MIDPWAPELPEQPQDQHLCPGCSRWSRDRVAKKKNKTGTLTLLKKQLKWKLFTLRSVDYPESWAGLRTTVLNRNTLILTQLPSAALLSSTGQRIWAEWSESTLAVNAVQWSEKFTSHEHSWHETFIPNTKSPCKPGYWLLPRISVSLSTWWTGSVRDSTEAAAWSWLNLSRWLTAVRFLRQS